jgi:hypothetical protein
LIENHPAVAKKMSKGLLARMTTSPEVLWEAQAEAMEDETTSITYQVSKS